ncbi:MAG TPA: hypothetical protein VGE27_06985 [Gemmatimonas sp.]|uniref:hypothetical protein n=1 Tax=Gemmatimonas sp. TaxID=1962908 RepID=UPI002EDAF39D
MSGIVGAVADRAFLVAVRRVRDQFRDEPPGPDGEIIARNVRIAQLEALSQLLNEYEHSIRRPRLFWSRSTRSLVERLPSFIALERERANDHKLSGHLRARFGARGASLTAINSALQDGTAGGTDADVAIQVVSSEAAHSATPLDRSAEQALEQLAEQAVLAELRQAVGPEDLPRDFIALFLGGRPGRDGFMRRFGKQLQHALTTTEAFYRAYTAVALADLQHEVREVRESSARVEESVGALRADQRLGVADADTVLESGDSLHFATTGSYFRRLLSVESAFHHGRPLVGREAVLARLLECVEGGLTSGDATVVSLASVGGSGKTRLLLEVARRVEPTTVRWVRDGELVSFAALSELPAGPLVLFCDDAQRRQDLTELIRLVDFRREPTVLILGARPYGRAAVSTAVNVAKLPTENFVDLGILAEVPKNELEGIVAKELGPAYAHAAYDLLRLAGGSILVALVAGRLLRTKNRDPRTVPLDADFQQIVLESFREESVAALPDILDQRAAQRTLDALAAVQPVTLREGELAAAFAAYVGVDGSTLQRILDTLVRAGVLRDERSGLRIQPDVLGDHILHRAMVARGAPTQLDRELLERLGPAVLLNLVQNVAELDWQREASGDPVRMFEGVWTSFIQAFRAAPLEDQREWLRKLAPVAAFQPRAMLDFAHMLLTMPPDVLEERGSWGMLSTYAQVLEELPPLIALAAHHRPAVAQALDLLWNLGQRDARETNPYPEHGIRQLKDLVGYSRHRDLWMQDAALDAMERWLADARWARHLHTPLLVADAVLATEMMEQTPARDGLSLTLTRHGVNAKNTMSLRLRAIAITGQIARSGDVYEKHEALRVLLNALECQRGTLGHEVTEDEEEAFRDQFTAILDVFDVIVRSRVDPVAMLLIRTRLHIAAHHTHLDWKASRMREVAATVPDDEDTRLARALGYFNSDWHVADRSVEEEMAADEENRIRVAKELAAGTPVVPLLVARLGAMCEAWMAARDSCDASPLMYSLASHDPALALALARHLLEHAAELATPQVEWLSSLLTALRPKDTSGYGGLLEDASAHDDRRVRAAAAWSMARVLGARQRFPSEMVVLRRLLRDAELVVSRAAIRALAVMEAAQVELLLGDVQVHGDRVAARNLADTWGMRRRDDTIPILDDVTATHLLGELVPVPDFGQAETSIGLMLSAIAETFPHRILDFLDARIRREHMFRAERASEGRILDFSRDDYDAIPYRGFDGLQDAFERSPDYVGVIERVLGALGTVVDGSLVHDAAAHDVLRNFGRWDGVLEEVLRGWMTRGDHDMLVRASPLFSRLTANFVLDQHPLMADLLEFLDACEPSVKATVTNAMIEGAFSGPPVARSVGTPSLVLSRVADGAALHAEFYAAAGRPRVHAFYAELTTQAREQLERERVRDETSAAELTVVED